MKTLHLRDTKDISKGQQVITVVSEVDQEKSIIRFAFSVCSKHDTFSKKYGREQALLRFEHIGQMKPDDWFGFDPYKFSAALEYDGWFEAVPIIEFIKEHVYRMIDADENRFKFPLQSKEISDAYIAISKANMGRLNTVELTAWEKIKLHLYKFYYLSLGI